ncbi:hypothetical protein BATDEDRAFT_27676 [Batrachochytrium dendrobatidis JAM81]|uniref:C3H1-type domain-containing protein n=1 Tax=Batrachochytrium dendrobatidis (strain JAM81 / FGSC 10211) TaxID=684364 RepID=F4PBL0_BATDJ|nr:uncharacterized protein BATDEDRAFT_27676 [Batrachochytrium dendrobatidis JAM81]EGF77464.1 hypothetical protein BATDEDRAFT_27676 [Batrachochytrium dendrobatidis JAM81]KAJ8327609.1 hypothetical protein O5D80_003961 [Batrachochytrium dendrobatidis]KAK5669243.1 hypothetical protein QVD99_003653 [Batrachochytrium dendrobatidis]|eukprot:XP_006681935.1 hypothetical protein BATDEDRAFT_27676 [Batrachochytrium dendrobatidis JAM81]
MTATLLSFNVVNRHNLSTLSLTINHILSRAHHVALDAEFTGLGDPQLTRQRNIEDRYRELANVARTHALVAFGLSIFEQPDPKHHPEQFTVNTFQFTMLSCKEHRVNPSSLAFLAEHKFDFNDQISNGIPYMPGNDIAGETDSGLNAIMRSILNQIIIGKIPTVVHNGLLDSMFVYQSFYAELPKDLTMFIADLNGMFRGGIYDTKYVSEFVTRESRTFLSYLFRKYERIQLQRQKANAPPYLTLAVKNRIQHKYTLTTSTLAELGLVSNPTASNKAGGKNKSQKAKNMYVSNRPYCEQYAAHGFCSLYSACAKSHDLDMILDWEEKDIAAAHGGQKVLLEKADNTATTKSEKDRHSKKKRKIDTVNDAKIQSEQTPNLASLATETVSEKLVDSSPKPPVGPAPIFETYHSACFDAYMTGFIFCHQCLECPNLMKEHGDRLYLIGKDMPIRVEKSIYTKTSQQHQDKMKRLKLV